MQPWASKPERWRYIRNLSAAFTSFAKSHTHLSVRLLMHTKNREVQLTLQIKCNTEYPAFTRSHVRSAFNLFCFAQTQMDSFPSDNQAAQTWQAHDAYEYAILNDFKGVQCP